MAGLVNAMARLHNRRARVRIAELEQAIVAATEHRHATRTRASYEDTLAAGYIDLNFLDTA
jgi:phosphosulfolactate phosphohydrolase-like enzyme